MNRREGDPARIGLDMHVVDGLHQGSRTHCLELFSRVVELLPTCRFFVFLDAPEYLQQHWPSFLRSNVCLVKMKHATAARRLLLQLPRLVKAHGLDLLHTQYIVPPFSTCSTAVTIHDLLFESYPEFFPLFFRLRSKLLIRRSARQSSLIFTVSHYSKQELIDRYGVPKHRMTVIMNGVSKERFAPGADLDAELPAGLTSRGYILAVGRLEPRKNYFRLLKAYVQLEQPRPKLVLVGQRDFGFEELIAEVGRLCLLDEVLLLEDVSDAMLPVLYRNALIFAYPTLAEGFGMPVIEAMAAGVPVVTSCNTSLPEVAGEAAHFCDPLDVASIRQALCDVLSDPTARAIMISKGLKRAAEFSWDESARRLASAYKAYLQC